MASQQVFQTVRALSGGYLFWIAVLLLFVMAGGYCAFTLEHEGHHLSGMNNSVVWGLPHVFAISLILSASGALNGATLSSVLGNKLYSPYARLSVVLAVCLLVAGLIVLVLDLGRPDRLVIAMTTYNFRSIFSWNIFLYTGFVVVGLVYLAVLLERSLHRFTLTVGVVALVWRIVLTTGTGCIFGFLVGRSALDSAIMAPLFIAMSLVMGSAALILIIAWVQRWQLAAREPMAEQTKRSFARLMIWCLIAVLYFSLVHHLANLYVAEHRLDEHNVLTGSFAGIFWLSHLIVAGVILILGLSLSKTDNPIGNRLWSLLNGMAFIACSMMLYTVIIGSQSTPQVLFPDKEVINSSFGDATVAAYQPTLWEWGLGAGGVALALLLVIIVLRVLPIVSGPAAQRKP